jgi:hypothetical protein
MARQSYLNAKGTFSLALSLSILGELITLESAGNSSMFVGICE